MKIFLLKRKDYVAYDEYKGFVIAAKNKAEASAIANTKSADEGRIWSDSDIVDVSIIGTADKYITESCVLIDSFRAG